METGGCSIMGGGGAPASTRRALATSAGHDSGCSSRHSVQRVTACVRSPSRAAARAAKFAILALAIGSVPKSALRRSNAARAPWTYRLVQFAQATVAPRLARVHAGWASAKIVCRNRSHTAAIRRGASANTA